MIRNYQARSVDLILKNLHKNPILVMPCGGGKTYTAGQIAKRVTGKILWTVHRRELVEQAKQTLHSLGVDADVKSIQSIRSKIKKYDLIIIDECHRAKAESYKKLFEQGCRVLGLTATPYRLDGQPLDCFGHIVEEVRASDLIKSGVLVRPTVYAPNVPSLKKSDYNLKNLNLVINKRNITGEIVDTWIKRAGGVRTICFCVSIDHSKNVVAEFIKAGVKAEHIDGNTSGLDRDAILNRLRTGETTIVSNVYILTEGFDMPSISCCIIARPTASLNMHIQMIGRAIRCFDGKTKSLILDHAGNHIEHGGIERVIQHTLTGVTKGASSEELGYSMCVVCGLLMPATLDKCENCGSEKIKKTREINPEQGELILFSDKMNFWNLHRDINAYKKQFNEVPIINNGSLVEINKINKRLVYKCLMTDAIKLNYSHGWASHAFKKLYNVWPKGFVTEVKKELGIKPIKWRS